MCGEDLVFGGLCRDAGQSGLSGPGPGDLLPPAAAHVCTTLRQSGQPGAQPLCTSSMHLTLKINNRHSTAFTTHFIHREQNNVKF